MKDTANKPLQEHQHLPGASIPSDIQGFKQGLGRPSCLSAAWQQHG